MTPKGIEFQPRTLASDPPDTSAMILGITAGQNFQTPAMLKGAIDSGEYDPEISHFQTVSRVKDPANMTDDELAKGHVMQPATTTSQIISIDALKRELEDLGLHPVDFFAGMSLGGIAADFAVGSIGSLDAISLSHARGISSTEAQKEALQRGYATGMMALQAARVKGVHYSEFKDLLRKRAETVAEEVNTRLQAFHIGTPTDTHSRQLGLSGTLQGMDLFKQLWEAGEEKWVDRDRLKGKFTRLDVNTAFHTVLMSFARRRMIKVLNRIPVEDPNYGRLLSSTTISELTTADEVREEALLGLTQPVEWRSFAEFFASDVIGNSLCKKLLLVEPGPSRGIDPEDQSVGNMIKFTKPTLEAMGLKNIEGGTVEIETLRISQPADAKTEYAKRVFDNLALAA